MADISNTDKVIDIRDVIARVEDLREQRDAHDEPHGDGDWALAYPDCAGELTSLEALLEECKGNGGDEQWEGDWYPVTLIHDDYFVDHAQELADDIGAATHNAVWPYTCIDWDKAADELQMDYTSVEFAGQTYWTR